MPYPLFPSLSIGLVEDGSNARQTFELFRSLTTVDVMDEGVLFFRKRLELKMVIFNYCQCLTGYMATIIGRRLFFFFFCVVLSNDWLSVLNDSAIDCFASPNA